MLARSPTHMQAMDGAVATISAVGTQSMTVDILLIVGTILVVPH